MWLNPIFAIRSLPSCARSSWPAEQEWAYISNETGLEGLIKLLKITSKRFFLIL